MGEVIVDAWDDGEEDCQEDGRLVVDVIEEEAVRWLVRRGGRIVREPRPPDGSGIPDTLGWEIELPRDEESAT